MNEISPESAVVSAGSPRPACTELIRTRKDGKGVEKRPKTDAYLRSGLIEIIVFTLAEKLILK